jgi:hypothetical protein
MLLHEKREDPYTVREQQCRKEQQANAEFRSRE